MVADRQRRHPVDVLLRRAQAVDAGDRRDHDDVAPGEQRAGGRVPQPLDLVVDRRVLLDVGVRLRDVRLGLVVVVVRDEVLDRVVGQQLAELGGQLRGERLVGRHHERRPLHLLDQPGRRRRLAGAGGAEQHDVLLPRLDPRRQLLDRRGLVTGRRVLGDHLERRDGPLEVGDRTHATTVRATTDNRASCALRRAAPSPTSVPSRRRPAPTAAPSHASVASAYVSAATGRGRPAAACLARAYAARSAASAPATSRAAAARCASRGRPTTRTCRLTSSARDRHRRGTACARPAGSASHRPAPGAGCRASRPSTSGNPAALRAVRRPVGVGQRPHAEHAGRARPWRRDRAPPSTDVLGGHSPERARGRSTRAARRAACGRPRCAIERHEPGASAGRRTRARRRTSARTAAAGLPERPTVRARASSRPVAVQHDVRDGQPLLVVACASDARLGLAPGHPAEPHQPLDPQQRRGVHDDEHVERVGLGFSTSSGMSCTTTAPWSGDAATHARRRAGARSGARSRSSPPRGRRRRTRSRPAPRGRATRPAASTPAPNSSTTASSPADAGRDRLARQHVGVDHHRPELRQSPAATDLPAAIPPVRPIRRTRRP